MIVRRDGNYYTRDEAAELARCSPSSIARWQSKGMVAQQKIGQRIYVPERELPRLRKLAEKEDSICWDCIRSAAPKEIRCIWDRTKGKTPVEGATVKFIDRRPAPGMSSCVVGIVTDCPLFVSLYEDGNLDKIRRLRRCAEV